MGCSAGTGGPLPSQPVRERVSEAFMGWTEHALVVRANPEVSLIPRKTSIVKIAMTAPDSVLVTRFSSFASSPRLAMPDTGLHALTPGTQLKRLHRNIRRRQSGVEVA